MGITQYIKQVGRRHAPHALTREQAADAFGQMLDGTASDLEVGAFCLAMRLKGESVDELHGFVEATQARLHRFPAGQQPLIVLPSYNGARRLPVLTPLLALLLARRGQAVLVHGTPTETSRVFAGSVLQALDIHPLAQLRALEPGEAAYARTSLMHEGLGRLLAVRTVIGLRNSSHSVVKVMNPCAGAAVIVTSYTHADYAEMMGEVFRRLRATALMLRGTEGEAAADARRMPAMAGYIRGERLLLEERQAGTLTDMPELPAGIDAETTAAWINDVLAGRRPVPAAIAVQVEHILRLAAS